MKKIKKCLVMLSIIIGILVLTTIKSNASSSSSDLYLNNLNFDVKINTNGSMEVTETWDIDISDTNTLYKTFEMDSSRFTNITDVKVKEVTKSGAEENFTKINQEMYHVTKNCYYGLINKNGDFEIAWGVGLDHSHKTKKYKISYIVEGAINNCQDCSELYWQFVGKDFEISAKKITGTITLPANASNKENIRVWGHTEGLNGEIYAINENTIEFNINKFRSGRFVEVRIAIPKEIFIYSSRYSPTLALQNIIEEETKWAGEANARRTAKENTIKTIVGIVIVICIIIDIVVIKRIIDKIKKIPTMRKYKPTQEFEYYREIPDENMVPAEAVFIIKQVKSSLEPTDLGKVFSATLLDLSLKNFIQFEAIDKKNINIKISENYNIDQLTNESEKVVFNFILDTCKNKNCITIKQLEKYIKAHSSMILDLKTKIDNNTIKSIENNGVYDKKEIEKYNNYIAGIVGYIFIAILGVITSVSLCIVTESLKILIAIIPISVLSIICIVLNAIIISKLNIYTQKGVDEHEKLKGLKKFMEDFSMLDKREIPELVLWEKYLVYATAFGIAEKVLKQLKVVYPEVMQMDNFNTGIYIGMMMNTDFSSSFSHSISSAMSSTYSSGSGGGGGFSGGGGRWTAEVAGGGGR